MTDHITAAFIGITAVFIILYDVSAVWRGGGDATISWTMLTWWTVHPFVIVGVFALIGHLFFPECATTSAEMKSLSPVVGTFIGAGASAVIAWEVFDVWWRQSGKPVVLSHWYLWRLAVLSLVGVLIGHLFFTQYVSCAA